jgi:FKBP-type peptidyl-prolyl cis-trans isomerase SlyD
MTVIEEGHVVGYRFTIRGDEGEVLAVTADDEIAYYLHGHGTWPPGLEKHLAGRQPGERFEATLAPSDGFGERQEQQLVPVSRDTFPSDVELAVGMHVAADLDGGDTIALWVAEVSDEQILLDVNHPLAGRTLHVEVEVVSSREASEDELAHGHPHVDGDHHH